MQIKPFNFLISLIAFTTISANAISQEPEKFMPGSDPSSYTPIEFLDPHMVEISEKGENQSSDMSNTLDLN